MKTNVDQNVSLDIISGLLMSIAAGVMVSMILSVLVLMLPSEVHVGKKISTGEPVVLVAS